MDVFCFPQIQFRSHLQMNRRWRAEFKWESEAFGAAWYKLEKEPTVWPDSNVISTETANSWLSRRRPGGEDDDEEFKSLALNALHLRVIKAPVRKPETWHATPRALPVAAKSRQSRCVRAHAVVNVFSRKREAAGQQKCSAAAQKENYPPCCWVRTSGPWCRCSQMF